MLKLFSNLKVRTKILLLLALPLAGLAYFAGNHLMEKIQVANENKRLVKLIRLSTRANVLVHELQKERGASAGFISSKGQKMGDVLRNQRSQTNTKKQQFYEFVESFDTKNYGNTFQSQINDILSRLGQMEDIRGKVDTLTMTIPEAVRYYTELNAKLIGNITEILRISTDIDINTQLSAYINFAQSKERAGLERAMGSSGFAGGFSPELGKKMTKLITIQDIYLDVFRAYASKEQLQFLSEKMQQPAVAEVRRMRDIGLASVTSGDTQGIEAKYWFATITDKINLLKMVEDRISEDIMQLAETKSQSADQSKLFALLSLGGLTILVILLSVYIVKSLNGSIQHLTVVMQTLAEGNTDIDVPYQQQQNEIGDIAKTVEIFKQSILQERKLKQEQDQMQQTEQLRRQEERQRLMNELASEFESTVSGAINKVFDTANGLSQASSAMGEATSNASQKSLQVASTSGETSSNVQTVAGAAEEMTASIREIAKQVTKSKQVIDEAVQRAESADQSAQVLSKAVISIGEVTDLINDITDKINMLALNATIESARAGEAGKGFAVVANEVKDLANQTSIATKDIAKEIANIQSISTEVIDVMRAIREAISNVNEYSSSIATAVEEQSAATNEISMNMLSAADGVQNISNNIEDVTQAAELADSAANEVLEASQMLTEQAELLDNQSRGFIDNIRKAS